MNLIKSTFSIFIAFLLLGISSNVQAQSLEEILEEHFAVMKVKELMEVKSVKTEGKMIMMDGQMEMGMKMTQLRPNKSRTEMDFQGNAFVTVYDGESAWMINPMQGPDPSPLPEEQVEQMRQQSYIEGILYNHKEKGYEIELVGEDEVEGSPTYKLKVIPQVGNSDSFFIHLDQDSYIPLKIIGITTNQGQESESEIFLSNYKEVDGILFPHSMETHANGQVMEMVFEKITLNLEVDESIFESNN